jgi:hypothetical protein
VEFVFDAPSVGGSRIQPRRTGLQASDVVADFAFAFAAELGYSCDLGSRVPASVAEPVEPIFEPIFDDASFGYRRRPKDALRKVWGESRLVRSGSWMRICETFSIRSTTNG